MRRDPSTDPRVPEAGAGSRGGRPRVRAAEGTEFGKAMWIDVVELRDFYETGPGLVARRMIRGRLRAMWPDVAGRSVLGVGYATPFLRLFHAEAVRTIALMPAQQGVLRWPNDEPNAVALCDETYWPVADQSIDRLVLVHAVEHSEALRRMLREAWRVLSDDGRMILVTPNRRGIWARLERTPFGHGRPFSEGQIARLLRDQTFTPLRTEGTLFVPPFRSRMLLSTAPAWERLFSRWLHVFAGVLLTEASKQVYAATPVPAKARRRLVPVPGNAAAARGAEARLGTGEAASRPSPRPSSAARAGSGRPN